MAGLLVEAEGEVGELACLGLKYLEKTKRTLLQETLYAVLRGFLFAPRQKKLLCTGCIR